MAIGDRIRKRREENGWTAEDFAKAKARREAIWGGIKTVSSFVPIASQVTGVIDVAVSTGKTIVNSKKPATIAAVLNAADVVVAKATEMAVSEQQIPEFTPETAELLSEPLVRVAMEMAQKIIDEVEARTKIDIPEAMEKAILDAILDVMDDATDYLEEEAMKMGKNLLAKFTAWIKGLLSKKQLPSS